LGLQDGYQTIVFGKLTLQIVAKALFNHANTASGLSLADEALNAAV